MSQFLHSAGADAADKVVDQEALRAPHLFHDAAEHPQGEHIEEDVAEPAMHEHVGHELVEVEVGSAHVVETEHVADGQKLVDDERCEVEQQEGFDNRRNSHLLIFWLKVLVQGLTACTLANRTA